jgi:predicted methyltransferase
MSRPVIEIQGFRIAGKIKLLANPRDKKKEVTDPEASGKTYDTSKRFY